jgi:hypothetical protein
MVTTSSLLCDNREKRGNNEETKMRKTAITVATLAMLCSTPAIAGGKTELQVTNSGLVTDTILGAKKGVPVEEDQRVTTERSYTLRNRWQLGYDGTVNGGVVLTQMGVGNVYGFSGVAEARVLASRDDEDIKLAVVPYAGVRYAKKLSDDAKLTVLLRAPVQERSHLELLVVPYKSIDLSNGYALTFSGEQLVSLGPNVLKGVTRASATYGLFGDLDVGLTAEITYGVGKDVTTTVGALARVTF